MQTAETTLHLQYVCTLKKCQPCCIHIRGHRVTRTIPVQNIMEDYKLDYQYITVLEAWLVEGYIQVSIQCLETLYKLSF
jgi:hypothetical protein